MLGPHKRFETNVGDSPDQEIPKEIKDGSNNKEDLVDNGI